jgi:hypothetical protein
MAKELDTWAVEYDDVLRNIPATERKCNEPMRAMRNRAEYLTSMPHCEGNSHIWIHAIPVSAMTSRSVNHSH